MLNSAPSLLGFSLDLDSPRRSVLGRQLITRAYSASQMTDTCANHGTSNIKNCQALLCQSFPAEIEELLCVANPYMHGISQNLSHVASCRNKDPKHEKLSNFHQSYPIVQLLLVSKRKKECWIIVIGNMPILN